MEKYIEILEDLISEIVECKIKIEVKRYDNINVIKGFNDERTCKILITNEKIMKVYYKYNFNWFYDFDPEDDYKMINIILNILSI